MIKYLKRYRLFIALLLIELLLFFIKPDLSVKAFTLSYKSLFEMLSVLPPIFILLGLMDVWMKKETLMKYMGEDSGLVGIIIAFVLGSIAAGPLYGAFPVAVVLLKKGCKLSNVFVMIGAWSTTKIPLLMFEASSMGLRFMLYRLIINIIGIIVMSYIITKSLPDYTKEEIYLNSLNDQK
ncbi:MAG: permease [Erysipelotrichaceae bacterium]|nr:permease [Erysipelotrichaceae bacterium]